MRAATLTLLAALTPIPGQAQPIDVSNDSISCNTSFGTASISPALVIGGTATSTTMRVKATLAGCTVTGPNPAAILFGKVSGRLTGISNECITLEAPLAGALTIRWKADKTTPILQKSSTVMITNVTFGGFGAPWNAIYGQFSLGTGGVTGAFTGGDGGSMSSNVSLTSQDIGEILAGCGSPKGLDELNTGLGQFTLQ
jgi:hypothetical protein